MQVERVEADPQLGLLLPFKHFEHGKKRFILDPRTLKATHEVPRVPMLPKAERKVVTPGFDEMVVNLGPDAGASGDAEVSYVLRWETLARNRDLPRAGPVPDPTMLRVYRVRTPAAVAEPQ